MAICVGSPTGSGVQYKASARCYLHTHPHPLACISLLKAVVPMQGWTAAQSRQLVNVIGTHFRRHNHLKPRSQSHSGSHDARGTLHG